MLVRNALHASDTLYAYAATRADAEPLAGRGAAYRIGTRAGPWVVRRYRRGGAMAGLLGDRYPRLGRARAWGEIAVSEAARTRGVRTPRVMAAAVYARGAFLRSDLATEYVPDSEDLAALGFGRSARSDGEKQAGFRAAGQLVRELGQRGLVHPDLNLRNILISFGGERAQPVSWALDLDRARIGRADASAMYARLRRSLAKEEGRTRQPLAANLRQALDAGFRG